MYWANVFFFLEYVNYECDVKRLSPGNGRKLKTKSRAFNSVGTSKRYIFLTFLLQKWIFLLEEYRENEKRLRTQPHTELSKVLTTPTLTHTDPRKRLHYCIITHQRGLLGTRGKAAQHPNTRVLPAATVAPPAGPKLAWKMKSRWQPREGAHIDDNVHLQHDECSASIRWYFNVNVMEVKPIYLRVRSLSINGSQQLRAGSRCAHHTCFIYIQISVMEM